MQNQTKLNYVEFAAKDLKASSDFFTAAFDWQFTWYCNEFAVWSE